jgi:hypothetical protein
MLKLSTRNCIIIKVIIKVILLCSFFWVILWRQNFVCRRFGTLCFSIFLGGDSRKSLPAYTTENVPKRRHIQFRRRVIPQKKEYNIRNTAKVWNQESYIVKTGLKGDTQQCNTEASKCHVWVVISCTAVTTDLGHPYWIYITPTHDQFLLLQFLVFLMMDTESVRNM